MAVDERALDRRQPGGALATEAPSNPWSSAGLLKPYTPDGIVYEAPRSDALATISAGFKNAQGFPEPSRDGTIYYRDADRAPGLIAELERRGSKSLTIALVHNDPKSVLQQWFAAYSKTRLEAHGDADQVTIITLRDTGKKNRRSGDPIMAPERTVVWREQDPARYAQLIADMKVQTSLYFTLAAWEGDEPRLYFPDGLGLYRLHFTSLNSAEAIKGQLAAIAQLTHGDVAGVPLELSITYRNLAGPDGVRREKVPIWSLVLKPPETIRMLSPGRVASILQRGLEQARSLSLPTPQPEALALAAYEGPDVDLDSARIVEGEVVREPTSRQTKRLAEGGPIMNAERCRSEYEHATRGTSLADEDGQRAFLLAWSGGRFTDLETFIANTSVHGWSRFLDDISQRVNEELSARQESGEQPAQRPTPTPRGGRGYKDLFPHDDESDGPEASTAARTADPAAEDAPSASDAIEAPAAPPSGQPTGAVGLPPEPDWMRSDERPLMLASWSAWAGYTKRLDPSYEIPDTTKLKGRELVAALRNMVGYCKGIVEEPSSGGATGDTDEVAF